MSRLCPGCGKELIEPVSGDWCADCGAQRAGTIRITAADEKPSSTGEAAAGDAAPRVLGDYELIEEIARGGMGVVYKARERSLNRIVALKMIRSDRIGHDTLPRFYTEAQAAARLQHPNIVAIHAVGEIQGQHFYSMDFVSGQSLAQISRERPVSARQAAGYVKKIAEAIHYAHQSGILHRDLKPSNVLIDSHDEPRVADFGLAKLMASDSELTLTGVVMGTPSYMPPEQARGDARDVAAGSDIYSLGAILYDTICGRPPFRAETTMETLRQVVEMQPVPPRVLNPKTSRDLETICLKCLEKNPAARYASAEALAEELGRFLRGEPILARPVSAPEQLWRWCQRKPAAATALGLLMAVAVASPVVALVINHARRDAERNRAVAEANLYVADMNLALDAVRSENRARALTLLRRHIPKPGEPDRRGFEWRYIWQQARGDYAFKLGFHADTVRQVLFSPDGKMVVTRSTNGVARVWDVATRRNRLTLTNVESLGGFSEDEVFAVGTVDGDVEWISMRGGERRAILTNAGTLVRWFPNQRRLATTSTNYLLRFWGVGGQAMETLAGGGGAADPTRGPQWGLNVALSADGTILAAIEKTPGELQRRTVQISYPDSGRMLARSPPAEAAIAFVEISPDGNYVAWGVDGALHIWNWRSERAPRKILAHGSTVRMIAFSADGALLATGASDQFLKIWETSTGRLLETRKGHENSVRALGFSPDGQWLVSGGLNEAVRVWNLRQAPQTDSIEIPAPRKDLPLPQRELLFSPDGRRLALSIDHETAAVLDCASLSSIALVSNVQRVLRFVPAGDRVLTAASRPPAGLSDWEFGTGKMTPVSGIVPASLQLETAAVSRNGWAAPDSQGILHLRTLGSDHDFAMAPSEMRNIEYLVCAPDGRSVAALGGDPRILLWDVPSGNVTARWTNHADKVHHIAFSPDGQLLASGGRDKTVRLWSVKEKRPMAVLEGHRHAVYAVAFSPDGQLLASGSLDNTVKLWNVQLGQEVARLELWDSGEILPEKGAVMVAFSPDGNALACRTRNGVVRFWRAAAWEQIRAEEAH